MRYMLVICLLCVFCFDALGDDAILAYWDFESVEGRVVTETTGNFNGVLFNGTDSYSVSDDGLGPKVVLGHVDGSRALSLNGPDRKDQQMDSLFISNGFKLKLGQSDWTMAGWIRCRGFPEKQTDHMTVLSNIKPNSQGLNMLVLRPGHSAHGCLSVAMRGPDGDKPVYVNSKKPIDDGQWHWFAVMVEDKKLSLWVDGQKQGQRALTDLTTADPSGMLFMGTRDGLHGAFHGDLDNLLIYGKAIPARTDTSGILIDGKLFDLWENGIKALQPYTEK